MKISPTNKQFTDRFRHIYAIFPMFKAKRVFLGALFNYSHHDFWDLSYNIYVDK